MMLPLSLGTLEAEQQLLLSVTIALLVVATVSVVLRIFVRTRIVRHFGWDDWMIVAAYSFYATTCALSIALIQTQTSIETSDHDVSPVKIERLVRFHNSLYCLTVMVAKVSLGVFFLGLFARTTHTFQHHLIMGAVAIPTLVGVVYLGMTLFSCSVSVSLLLTDSCDVQRSYTVVSITWTALNSVSDVLLSMVAVLALCRSKLPQLAKISASALLVLGTTGGIASILRLVSQITAQKEELQGIVLQRWSNTEAGLCIAAASLVTLRPLFQKVVTKPLSRLSGSWGWSDKGTAVSAASITSKSASSRSNSFFSRKMSLSLSKTRTKSFSATMTDHSIKSQRSGKSRRRSTDPFISYIEANKNHAVAIAANDSTNARNPDLLADAGGLLALQRSKSEVGDWCTFGSVRVTLEVVLDVSSAEEIKRTKSVCFGPDVEMRMGGSSGGLLTPQRPRPALLRTSSAQ